jgi:streptomycin 6-kinase
VASHRPQPFVGDPADDATQHLLNCPDRLRADPERTVGRFTDLLGLAQERVRRWLFARVAAEPDAPWDDESMSLARALAA